MNIIKYPPREEWDSLLIRPKSNDEGIIKTVKEVLNDVKTNGDEAVRRYTLKFDKVNIDDLKVSDSEFAEAETLVDESLKMSIQTARHNIEKFHASQRINHEIIETMPGVKCWQKSVAIESVGLYVPGGTAPLFSSVLMLGIPAILAGCKNIVLCTPPNKEGKIHPSILYTAKLIGLTQVFKTGGIQSVGAMAYGTASIPKVSKIFGPGNLYVTVAKQLVTTDGVAIDMPAGPSEVAVMADQTCVPAFVAADLLSQAEHGVDSQVVLFTCNENILPAIYKEMEAQLDVLPRKEFAKKALDNSKTIVLKNYSDLLEITNQYAPEHLIIAMEKAPEVAGQITNAGSVFIGNYSCESAGDYASGTNHALPTAGYAKSYSGVNLDAFMRKITFQQLSADGMLNLGPVIEKMAEAELLAAHKNAATVRINAIKNERNK